MLVQNSHFSSTVLILFKVIIILTFLPFHDLWRHVCFNHNTLTVLKNLLYFLSLSFISLYQTSDSPLGNHFSNFKLSEFCVFKDWQLNQTTRVRSPSISWTHLICLTCKLDRSASCRFWKCSSYTLVHNDQSIYRWTYPQILWKPQIFWPWSRSSKNILKIWFWYLGFWTTVTQCKTELDYRLHSSSRGQFLVCQEMVDL